MNRIPRKLKKHNKKRIQTADITLANMFNRAKSLADRYDTKTDTTFQKRLNQIKELYSIINK